MQNSKKILCFKKATKFHYCNTKKTLRSLNELILFKFLFAALVLSKAFAQNSITEVIPPCTYKIIQVYSHDRGAFSQGLVFKDGFLYESTGINGRSTLRKVDLKTGKILQIRTLPAQFFAEGITIFGNKIIQLTWKSKVGFVYNQESFNLLQTFHYSTEGWGITNDGKRLIMSDGSSKLYFLDPETFVEIGRIEVHDKDGPVDSLNELEYIQGEIFANVWPTDRIARISPQTGQIIGWIDLSGILSLERRVDVLNGIAYDANNDRIFVTGKWWPKLFEIELIPPR